MRGKKILVIGGTGFLGFHLIKRCISLKMIITSISKQKPCQSQRLDNVEYKTCKEIMIACGEVGATDLIYATFEE